MAITCDVLFKVNVSDRMTIHSYSSMEYSNKNEKILMGSAALVVWTYLMYEKRYNK